MSAAVLTLERYGFDAPAGAASVLFALVEQLWSLEALLTDLGLYRNGDFDPYREKASRASGSVGEHVRHILDHVNALLAHGDGELSYDSRLRGTPVERDPSAALSEVRRLLSRLEGLDEGALAEPLTLRTMTHRDRPASRLFTTLGREVSFVVQHTVHHCALIAVLLDVMGVRVAAGFGYAASTPLPRGH